MSYWLDEYEDNDCYDWQRIDTKSFEPESTNSYPRWLALKVAMTAKSTWLQLSLPWYFIIFRALATWWWQLLMHRLWSVFENSTLACSIAWSHSSSVISVVSSLKYLLLCVRSTWEHFRIPVTQYGWGLCQGSRRWCHRPCIFLYAQYKDRHK